MDMSEEKYDLEDRLTAVTRTLRLEHNHHSFGLRFRGSSRRLGTLVVDLRNISIKVSF